ncbi:histidine kinase [Clostridium carboxidivorans P7]|uniref:Signal transduction histidine kinase, LytS n=1 Tax=Clostridium carboxidivorans P7 TaxID=536227 RepID=C6PYP2_9CLOT|nr:PocR ligand-binding domain-containing protein [Clostridium carboxidivorans]AKN32020.1 histidine kinase [Clostridium carboxidivorans P7]EET85623.1 signal transduction histidine kinase, LytS [Clostridium carboxidivorans P7]EFG87840.1 ATPase, histidine kinase-, DNA gyrase B-, and HSP90-like domain protein [Clostridium carboxidivorans P7]
MNTSKKYKLEELIDIISVQHIQDKFSKLTNMSTITVNEKGTPIVNPSNFSEFCNLIRSSEEGFKKCINCDANGGLKSISSRKPEIYTCHAGLTDFSAPIIVNNYYLGAMLCGQVFVKEKNNRNFINIKELSDKFSLPCEKLEAALDKVIVLEYNKIIDMAEFLYLFANLIAKMGMSNLIQGELLDETKEKMKFQQLAKDMQLKSLQAQVNPHFLFNTLNTIARMSLIEDAPNTEKLIYALSDILRYSLKNSDNMVQLNTEIDNIEKYLFIQTTRYSDRINFEIDVPENIGHYKIPVMTLQPLVENAIIHGLEPKKDPGLVTIKAKIFNGNINVEISDNGVGMTPEKINLIINNTTTLPSNTTGLGIQNVNGRIKYYFGPEFGIKIENNYPIGTKVSVTIPAII